MCFILTELSEPLIAKENIKCYKIFKIKENIIISPFQDFIYEVDTKYDLEKELEIVTSNNYHRISEGFHSYSSYRYAKGEFRYLDKSDCALYECIIPEGSKYFYQPACSEYVSDSIIVKEIKN